MMGLRRNLAHKARCLKTSVDTVLTRTGATSYGMWAVMVTAWDRVNWGRAGNVRRVSALWL